MKSYDIRQHHFNQFSPDIVHLHVDGSYYRATGDEGAHSAWFMIAVMERSDCHYAIGDHAGSFLQLYDDGTPVSPYCGFSDHSPGAAKYTGTHFALCYAMQLPAHIKVFINSDFLSLVDYMLMQSTLNFDPARGLLHSLSEALLRVHSVTLLTLKVMIFNLGMICPTW